MWVLAIDTATPRPGLAIAGKNREDQRPLPTGRRSSEALLPGIEDILAAASLSLGDVGRIAVCSGPGSFTGIRVGLATAWGLSRARPIPIETFGSLEAVAEIARGTGVLRVCPSFEAEREDVYFGEYDLESPRAAEIRAPMLLPRDALSEACPSGSLGLPLGAAIPG
ncbi:MAG: tRNA (adenosine(37)-N6)-threonylcarbamoyltransferase complex dimerization subunit type 1 TsaB, partial [Thermoanaerobaculia bacterium]